MGDMKTIKVIRLIDDVEMIINEVDFDKSAYKRPTAKRATKKRTPAKKG